MSDAAPSDIDLAAAADDAVDRATRLLGAKQAASQRLTIVLDPRVASDFFSIIGGMLTGDVVLKGRSPFADRLGDAVASPLVSLVDDATNPSSFGADTHDGEGLATRPTTLIDKGVLKAFLHNSYTARRPARARPRRPCGATRRHLASDASPSSRRSARRARTS